MEFTGKSVIVTGAGKGIGRATALHLAERGAEVVALSRTRADLEALERQTGGRSVVADLSDPVSARAAMTDAGACDFLVNSAGTNVLESVLDMSDAGYETVMAINLHAALICAQEFARARVAAGGGGAIVNVTSIVGHRAFRITFATPRPRRGSRAPPGSWPGNSAPTASA